MSPRRKKSASVPIPGKGRPGPSQLQLQFGADKIFSIGNAPIKINARNIDSPAVAKYMDDHKPPSADWLFSFKDPRTGEERISRQLHGSWSEAVKKVKSYGKGVKLRGVQFFSTKPASKRDRKRQATDEEFEAQQKAFKTKRQQLDEEKITRKRGLEEAIQKEAGRETRSIAETYVAALETIETKKAQLAAQAKTIELQKDLLEKLAARVEALEKGERKAARKPALKASAPARPARITPAQKQAQAAQVKAAKQQAKFVSQLQAYQETLRDREQARIEKLLGEEFDSLREARRALALESREARPGKSRKAASKPARAASKGSRSKPKRRKL